MKRTIEIDDTLQDCVDSATAEVKSYLLEYLKENPDTDKTPCLNNNLNYGGAIHEIIDGAVPIYTKEINDIFYLHGSDIEAAFDDAGIGDKNDENWPMGWKAAVIYYYIEREVNEWYEFNADEIFESSKNEKI